MQKKKLFLSLGIIAVFSTFILIACSKGSGGGTPSPPDPCAGITITVTGTTSDADAGTPNGSITASASGGSGFTYSLNNGAFQASGNFGNLAPGKYSITAKNDKGCLGTASFTVNARDACAGKSITITPAVSQQADPCANNGIVSVTAAGSNGFTYNVDNGSFQSTGDFSNLSAGSHTFGAKDNAGCFKTAIFTVPGATAGPKFSDVKVIIQTHCSVSGCHGGTQAPNFAVDCNIVSNAALIKIRAVDQAGTPTQMPQPPRAALSQADRDKITLWFNAGHHFTD